MLELSLSSDAREPVASILSKVRAAYDAGVRTFWITNHLFHRDPATLAHAALQQCPELRAVLIAVNPFTEHPVQTAMSVCTLDELFPGRISLCLGSGSPADLRSLGIDVSKPLAAMREAVQLTRALLSGEAVRFAGERFRVDNRRLANGSGRIPLILAASGPKMLELAGAVADGVLITAGSSPQFVRWCVEHVRQGAGGRTLKVHGLTYAAVDEDETVACDRLRRTLGIVLRGPHHRKNLELAGSTLDQEALAQAVERGDHGAVAGYITNDIVLHHAIAGDAVGIRKRLEEYRDAGLDEAVLAGMVDVTQVTAILRAVSS